MTFSTEKVKHSFEVKTETFILDTGHRKIVMKVKHHHDSIFCDFNSDKRGEFGDEEQAADWAWDIAEKYLDQGLPVIVRDLNTMKVIIMHDDVVVHINPEALKLGSQ